MLPNKRLAGFSFFNFPTAFFLSHIILFVLFQCWELFMPSHYTLSHSRGNPSHLRSELAKYSIRFSSFARLLPELSEVVLGYIWIIRAFLVFFYISVLSVSVYVTAGLFSLCESSFMLFLRRVFIESCNFDWTFSSLVDAHLLKSVLKSILSVVL